MTSLYLIYWHWGEVLICQTDRQTKIESEQKHDVHRVIEKRGNKTQQTDQKWQRHSQTPTNVKPCEKSRHKSQHLHNKLAMTNAETVGVTTLMPKVVRQRGNYAIIVINVTTSQLFAGSENTPQSMKWKHPLHAQCMTLHQNRAMMNIAMVFTVRKQRLRSQ